jgi:hypothetical protein
MNSIPDFNQIKLFIEENVHPLINERIVQYHYLVEKFFKEELLPIFSEEIGLYISIYRDNFEGEILTLIDSIISPILHQFSTVFS